MLIYELIIRKNEIGALFYAYRIINKIFQSKIILQNYC
jgi:hypothetical protein